MPPCSLFHSGKTLIAVMIIAAVISIGSGVSAEEATDKKQSLQAQIEALEQEVSAIDVKLQETRKEGESLKREISILDNEIKKKQLELRRIDLAIRQANIDIAAKSAKIGETIRDIEKNRKILAKNIRIFYAYDQEDLAFTLVKNASLSDFFLAIQTLRTIQKNTDELVEELRFAKQQLETEKTELGEFLEEQRSLRLLREIERRGIEVGRAEKDRLLKETKGKESVFQSFLSAKKSDLTALKTQLFYLEKTGVTAEDAVKFAELAATRTGIRPAFLLALLEVETGKAFEDGVITAGTRLGSGNWKTDMYDCYFRLGKRSAAEAQKAAFFEITGQLHLDPNEMPVSRRPSYGCGGAMGPAQFIPTTWLLFEKRAAELTGHNPPNPWNIDDAFTAAAIFLADSGAASKTKEGELRAARTYISGRPSCPARGSARYACIWYGNKVVSLAAEIERIL